MTARKAQTRLDLKLQLEPLVRQLHGQARALWSGIGDAAPGDPLNGAAESLAIGMGKIGDIIAEVECAAEPVIDEKPAMAPAAVDLNEPIDELERAAAILAAVYDQACLNGPDVVEPPAIMAALRLVRSGLARIGEAS